MTDLHHDTEVAPPEAWDAISAMYDEHVAAGEVDLATAGLRLAGLKPGDSFLDVCAGTGGLSLPAARLGAEVLATDWAPKMIERFEARVREEGLANARGRVMDCHALDVPDDSYDVTGSQFGVMLVPDQAQALREMVRVTKPGGRVLLIAYGDPARFEALHVFVAAIQAVDPTFEGPASDEPMLEFQVADPDELRVRLEAAGLTDVTVDTSHEERVEVRTGKQLWDWCLGGNPIPGMLTAHLTDAQRADVIQVLDGIVRERSGGNGGPAVLTAPLNIAIGTKPSSDARRESDMTTEHFDKTYGTDAAQNYEDLFVPRIGRPCAQALVGTIGVQRGERVLDVACGTGIAARLAAELTAPGNVTGVDINAGMLAVAQAVAPDIDWREGAADALPVDDASADVVVCNLGLMFFPDKPAAVTQMHRVLSSGGRVGVLVPGPTPAPMAVLADALAKHIDPGLRGFVHAVFCFHDGDEIEALLTGAGFTDVRVDVVEPAIPLGPPHNFLWDYIHSTPLAAAVAGADAATRAALEDDVLLGWRDHTDGDDFVMTVRNTIAVGTK